MKTRTPLYAKLANDIRKMIEANILKAGERLPSLREMSRVKGVSIPTTIEAYRHLEDQKLIQVRPQSGYYVAKRERPARPSPGYPTSVQTADRTQVIERSLDSEISLQFDAAVPDDIFIPVHRLSLILSGLLRRDPGILGRNASSPGDLTLRNQIARRLIEWNCLVDPEKLVITNGGLEAIGLCLRTLTSPGDIVVVESPAYYGFLNLIDSFGLRVLEIPCDPKEGMILDELQAALANHRVKACLMSTSVSNPLGVTMPVASKRALLDLLNQNGIPLIEDATFADLHYGGPPPAVQSFDQDGNVLLCASLTKTLAPGFRLGWVYPGKYTRQVCTLKKVISGDQSEILQKTLAIYLENGGYERHLRRARQELQLRMDSAIEAIQHGFPPGTRLTRPSGGFLLWVELPRPIEVDFLQSSAIAGNLGVAPGNIFSALGQFQRHFRLNVAQADTQRLVDSLHRLGALIAQNS